MAVSILQNCKIYVSVFDVSGDHNRIAIAHSADAKEVTTFGDTTHKFIGGAKGTGFAGEGYWQGDVSGVDDVMFSRVGTQVLTTIAPLTGAEGEAAYFLKAMYANYNIGGQYGDVLPFTIEGVGTEGPLVRGTIMQTGERTTTADGTGYQLGAVAAGQKVYAGLHVFAGSGAGRTLDVKIQSDDNSGFTTATDRITFAQVGTSANSEILSAAGAITDTYWRAVWTIGGTTPSYTFAVVVGII